MNTMEILLIIFVPLVFAVIGAIISYKVTSKRIKKNMQKKPPFNRNQIREIFKAMGHPISEQNVIAYENSFKNSLEGIK
ncbi:MAG: YneF family protein [Mycoplasmataceae bacterium]|jgi:uncharacterized protein YneF (UPF0154 family)|nr:YneF family protein [Mycoplasmataceae bacterium]